MKKIGEVLLDYSFYNGEDEYTDGEIEDVLLDVVKQRKEKEVLRIGNSWPVLYHLSDIRENIIEWYPIEKEASVLEVGSGCGALTGILSKKAKKVTCIELSEKRSLINAYRNQERDNIKIIIGNFQDIELKEKFDYITLNGVLEYAGLYVNEKEPYLCMLKQVKKFLNKDGKILIAIENKMGLKYWNGAPEDHTGGIYDGINDYIGKKSVRTFSKQEIIELLKDAEIEKYKFYYPSPDYKLPEVIYSDKMLPTAGTIRTYRKDYNACRIYNFLDAVSYDQICSDQMFTYFSNSFFVVCGEVEEKSLLTKYSRIRKDEFRIVTDIKEMQGKRYVWKRALNEKAQKHIVKLKENEEKWKGTISSLSYVDGYIDGEVYVTDFVDGMDVNAYMYKYRHDLSEFIRTYQEIIKKYLTPKESELEEFELTKEFQEVFGIIKILNNVKTLSVTNVDLICSNLKFTTDKQLYCFDYEWIFDFPIPFEYVLWRNAYQLYNTFMAYFKEKISQKEFLIKVGILEENIEIFNEMEKSFCKYVYGKEDYLKNYRKSIMVQTQKFIS